MKRITIILLALCLLLNGAALAEGGKGPEPADGGAAAEIPLEEPGPDEEPGPVDGAEAELPGPAETPEPTPGPQALVVVEPPRAEGALVYGQPLSRVALAGGAVTVDGVEAEGMWAFIYPEEMPELQRKMIDSGTPVWRAVCDYISSMTDRYAIMMFESIYIPKTWDVL